MTELIYPWKPRRKISQLEGGDIAPPWRAHLMSRVRVWEWREMSPDSENLEMVMYGEHAEPRLSISIPSRIVKHE